MRPSPASWVPPGAWLAPGYAEWRPPAALRGPVACLWAQRRPRTATGAPGLVLPDGCSDLIWEQGVGALRGGPGHRAGPHRDQAGHGHRRRPLPPGGGRPGARPAAERAPRPARSPRRPAPDGARRGLPADAEPGRGRRAAPRRDREAGRGRRARPRHRAAASLLRDPAARTEDVAGRVGLSERQFRRRSHAAAGYGPKTLQRVLRFQRFVRLLDAAARASRTWPALPAATGYADQPHLTRECAALSGLHPGRPAPPPPPRLNPTPGDDGCTRFPRVNDLVRAR